MGLPQVPQAANEEDFQQYLLIYNAIHMLNAYLDELRLTLEGGDPEAKPSETMRFLRSFWLPAKEPIDAGNVVALRKGKVVKGADKTAVGFSTNSFLTGIALTTAETDEKVRFGVGPAVIEVPGFKAGGLVWAPLVGETGAGGMLAEEPPDEADVETIVIGKCVSDNFIMITSGFAY